MLTTYANYQMITRDITRSLDQIKNQPMVKRETEYYLANISKVTSIEEFVDDSRLFNYAMKAFGLSDMAYAKAFMVKAMEGGLKDSDSLANRMTDKRYAEFVQTFNFERDGATTTSFNQALHGTADLFLQRATMSGLNTEIIQADTAYYMENIVKVTSIDEFLSNSRLVTYALWSYNLEGSADNLGLVRQVLEEGIVDPDSIANKMTDKNFAAFAASFDFNRYGEQATTYNPTQKAVADRYLRQTLEENAGMQNEGVRLALYFKRKAPSVNSAYTVLSDPALSQVVRTALGLPESLATADIDRQADMLTARLDFADFKDPEKLEKFLTRFTSMWEINNPTNPQIAAASVLISPSVEMGISASTLMAIAQLKR